MAQAWSVVGGTAMEIVISRNTNLACSRHRLLPAVTLEVIQSEYTCHGATSTVTVFHKRKRRRDWKHCD